MKLEIKYCTGFKDRFLGMMFLKTPPKVGYYFPRCHSIHTFFCTFPLDVLLLDEEKNIIAIKRNLKPFRIFFFKCHSIIEVPSGYLKDTFLADIVISWSKK